jgi:predicted secreted protein
MKRGEFQGFKDHWNQTRGLPWDNDLRHAADEKLIRDRYGAYVVTDPWPEEVRRFGVFDVQGKGGRHFWGLAQAWAKGGKSRVLAYERLWSKEEIIDFQKRWQIQDDNMIIDAAHYTAEVYKMIQESQYRWKAFRGDEKPYFMVGGHQQVYTITNVDPAIGTVDEGRVMPIRLYLWSKPSALDRLGLMMSGQLGCWEIPEGIGSDFIKQVTAWERKSVQNKKTGALEEIWYNRREGIDHASDVCQMAVIGATLTGLLGT